MKQEVSQSIQLLNNETLFFKWALPLIEYLEEKERHTGILWVIECLIWASEHWNSPNKREFLGLLNLLTQMVKSREQDNTAKAYRISEIEKIYNSLWFHNENRDSLTTAIANCYEAERAYLLGNYSNHIQGLILLMGFGFEDDQTPEFFKSFCTESIKKYEKFIPN